jgi:TIR domain
MVENVEYSRFPAIGLHDNPMTDVFLSYSSKDRDRVRLIRDALAERGFDVFWDQTLPAGIDWDTWIRQHNVRHEAKIAKDQRKLLPVLIDDLAAEEFPMGLYVFQAAQLAIWHGNTHDDAWLRVLREIEDKLMPLWAKQRIDQLEAQLDAERGRREATERRDRTLRDQIATEARTQADLKHERDRALEEIAAVKDQLSTAMRERDRALEEIAAVKDQLSTAMNERDRALEEIAAVKEQLANGTPRAGAREQFAAPSENARKARLGQWWEARSKTDRVIWVVLLSILFFFFLGFFLRFLAGK